MPVQPTAHPDPSSVFKLNSLPCFVAKRFLSRFAEKTEVAQGNGFIKIRKFLSDEFQ